VCLTRFKLFHVIAGLDPAIQSPSQDSFEDQCMRVISPVGQKVAGYLRDPALPNPAIPNPGSGTSHNLLHAQKLDGARASLREKRGHSR
jgi:hypothetical protein